ncbi:Glia-derived nexin [Thelohanellus kitauei]|uniref:Glia-derived nexin n=1 Tax=Thelohanellus kitauei TaxID=669202 RepID=A0A0C2JCH6_THEKT|nr:Glia-derived nexin [Thelohanellus kitauei]
MLGAINLGLRGSSHDQLSHFLEENIDDVFDVENLGHFPTANRWSDLGDLISEFYYKHSSVHHSCDIIDRYDNVSTYTFRLFKYKVNFSDPGTAAQNLNEFIFEYLVRPRPNVFDESMIRENVLIFIDSLFISMDWKSHFYTSLTKQEPFYDNQGQSEEVAMMTQQKMNLIYDSPNFNFRILFKRFEDKDRYAVIVMPKEGHKIEDVLKNFKFDEMKIYFNASQRKYVKFSMPKFKILGPHDLVNTFKSFGLKDMFDTHRSDFGRMTKQPVHIGTFIQVIHFDIRESGVNTEIDYHSDDVPILEEGDEEEEYEEIPHTEPQNEKDRGDFDHSFSELDSEKDGDVEPRLTSENVDEDEDSTLPSDTESEDSEDPGDEASHDPEVFLVNRPFLFLMYSSKANVVFYTAVVTNPNAA